MKKKTLTTIILVVVLAMVAGVTVYAVANYGSKDDPLVTSSYLQDVVQPRMEDAYRSTLDGEVRDMEDQFADQVAARAVPTCLTLENGQTLTGRAGTEILMRTGTAAVMQSAAIDLTTGQTTAVGEKLTENHLYLVQADDSGIQATADTTVMVRGSYSIG
ncbi:MAG: hypothetical protein ACLSDI_02540 [Oscillospiraceae bacterium]